MSKICDILEKKSHTSHLYLLSHRLGKNIRTGKTKGKTFVFSSYWVTNVSKLWLKFLNFQILLKKLHSMKNYCIWLGDGPVRIWKIGTLLFKCLLLDE